MSLSIPSLILLAVMVMVRSAGYVAPAPLGQMAKPLAHILSYQTVETAVTIGSQGRSTVRTVTVFVRRGHAAQSYTQAMVTSAGHSMRSEQVSTDSKTCIRSNGRGPWQCAQAQPGSGPGRLTSGLPDALGELGAALHWSVAGSAVVKGQRCLAYRAVSLPGAQQQIAITLWIARAGKFPVALHGVTRFGGGSPTVLTEDVSWSAWNSPRLSIPAV